MKTVKYSARPERGSVSLEAAVALPIFFCVAVAMAFLLRVVQVHEKIQHAVCQAALEISGMGYAYGIADDAESLREAVINSALFENWLPVSASNDENALLGLAAAFIEKGAGSGFFQEISNNVTVRYLTGGEGGAGARGAAGVSNIAGGYRGLDFSDSKFLAGDDDVKIDVRYAFSLPIPISALSHIFVEQEASARIWLYGAESPFSPGTETLFEDDIWSLDNFTRGKLIQAAFHANLPDNFPGLSSYEDGAATLIRSLDTTSASYQAPGGIGRKIDGYVEDIANYSGQDKPWGNEGVVILPDDIIFRRLVLVIPRNDVSTAVSAEIDRCIRDALARGVIVQVEKFGMKNVNK